MLGLPSYELPRSPLFKIHENPLRSLIPISLSSEIAERTLTKFAIHYVGHMVLPLCGQPKPTLCIVNLTTTSSKRWPLTMAPTRSFLKLTMYLSALVSPKKKWTGWGKSLLSVGMN
jgi:hypothetical protein